MEAMATKSKLRIARLYKRRGKRAWKKQKEVGGGDRNEE